MGLMFKMMAYDLLRLLLAYNRLKSLHQILRYGSTYFPNILMADNICIDDESTVIHLWLFLLYILIFKSLTFIYQYRFEQVFSILLLMIFYVLYPFIYRFYYKYSLDLFYLMNSLLNEYSSNVDSMLLVLGTDVLQVGLILLRKCIVLMVSFQLIKHKFANQILAHQVTKDSLNIFGQRIYAHLWHLIYFLLKIFPALEITPQVLQYKFLLYLIKCFRNIAETGEIA